MPGPRWLASCKSSTDADRIAQPLQLAHNIPDAGATRSPHRPLLPRAVLRAARLRQDAHRLSDRQAGRAAGLSHRSFQGGVEMDRRDREGSRRITQSLEFANNIANAVRPAAGTALRGRRPTTKATICAVTQDSRLGFRSGSI